MAYSIVQHTNGQLSAGSISLPFPRLVTAGNCLVAWAVCQPLLTQTVSDTLNGPWVNQTFDIIATSAGGIWFLGNTLGGNSTVTLSATGGTNMVLMLVEIGGIATTSQVDNGDSISLAGVPANPTLNIFPVGSNINFIFGSLWLDNNSGSIDPGFTLIDNIGGQYVTEWRVGGNSGTEPVIFANSAPGTGNAMVQGLALIAGPTGGVMTHSGLLTVGVGRS